MKNSLVILVLLTCSFACQEKKGTNSATAGDPNEVTTKDTPSNTPKFEDLNGCSQYTDLYKILPHLDTYKGMGFRELECISEKQSDTASWTNLSVAYDDPASETKMEVNFYELNGDLTEERDVIRMAKATYTGLTQLPNFYKSGLTDFENASVELNASTTEDEYSTAIYLGTYKSKYAVLIRLELLGTTNITMVESFIKEYLEILRSNIPNEPTL